MIAFDVNVLIYAHREDQPGHQFYRDYLENLTSNSASFAISPLVATGFVRIVTNPRFPGGPTPLPQALAVIDSLVALGQCFWICPGQRNWQLTSELCRKTRAQGKAVADAQHAAIAIEHACQWVTRDRDFKHFTGHGLKLKILEPG